MHLTSAIFCLSLKLLFVHDCCAWTMMILKSDLLAFFFQLNTLPELKDCSREQLDRIYNYQFTLERAMLSNV